MASSILSKDPKIQEMQLEQKELLLIANLVAPSAEDASLVSISGALSARTISVDIKEPVKSVQKVRVINRASGASLALAAAPTISNTSVDGKVVSSSISVTVDGTGASSVCIEVSYR